jgi:hypothetical protein
MDRGRVPEAVDRLATDPGLLGVALKESLHPPLLQRPFAAGEEVGGGGRAARPNPGAEQVGGVTP